MLIDYKPKNESILDAKPVNKIVFEAKPSNSTTSGQLTDQLFAMTLGRGMWLGFSALTYPEAIDIISPKTP